MPVTKLQILRRGMSNRCPNCGQRTLFPPRSLRPNPRCVACGLDIERGEGFFLGPWCINYSIVVFGIVLPAIVLANSGYLPWGVAFAIAATGCIVVPALLYRLSWSWWLMLYFFFSPERLPANGGATGILAED